ncbi:MAG: hypothetical protein JXM69_13070 [Anaerolineae bacterium]|nr:hypothetical protein [Anaerolineae bacterium]
MNALQKSIAVGTKVFVSVRDRFTPKPDESPSSTPPAPKAELEKESQEPTHPVWNGELDEPIWW